MDNLHPPAPIVATLLALEATRLSQLTFSQLCMAGAHMERCGAFVFPEMGPYRAQYRRLHA